MFELGNPFLHNITSTTLLTSCLTLMPALCLLHQDLTAMTEAQYLDALLRFPTSLPSPSSDDVNEASSAGRHPDR